MLNIAGLFRRAFGYDAVESTLRRPAPSPTSVRDEDAVLTAQKRKQLQAGLLDVQRNFAVAAWAIRKHLDFVSSFRFSSTNGERDASLSALDDEIEELIARKSQASYCDWSRRHDLAAHLRMGESLATVLGDHFWLELADGSWQAIESDRIRTPRGEKATNVIHGVRVDSAGRAVEYAVHRRTAHNDYEFERWVPAEFVVVRGYYDRVDQLRGISPLSAAMNTLRDLYVGCDLALAKQRLAQLFGFKVKREGEAALGTLTQAGSDYTIDLGAGPWMVDLSPGDDIEIMQADVPGDSFRDYAEFMLSLALLALDLPWNFYKVDATNFFGSRAALNLYLKSASNKRIQNQRILHRWTRRQLFVAVRDGELRLPPGMRIGDLRFAWTADGLPWWNPVQEAAGHITAIKAGLDNPQRICAENGTSVFENIDKIAEVVAYAQSRGVKLNYAEDAS